MEGHSPWHCLSATFRYLPAKGGKSREPASAGDGRWGSGECGGGGERVACFLMMWLAGRVRSCGRVGRVNGGRFVVEGVRNKPGCRDDRPPSCMHKFAF